MSRLPGLERALIEAAERLDAQSSRASAPMHAHRWRRRGTPLLAALAALVVAGGAFATATVLLEDGDPVPADRSLPLAPASPAKGFQLASVQVADPGGGPPWGVGTFEALVGSRKTHDTARRTRAAILCIVVGRVQNGRLGVVGRDGVFNDDGRFHPLSPAAQSSNACAGRARNGAFVMFTRTPPIPASGYTGAPGTSVGGCREPVDLDDPTVSAQTRRKLRRVPRCREDSLRLVIAGYAGPQAETATLTAPGHRNTLELRSEENSPYLFVIDPPLDPSAAQLSISYRNGHSCDPFAHSSCPDTGRSPRPQP